MTESIRAQLLGIAVNEHGTPEKPTRIPGPDFSTAPMSVTLYRWGKVIGVVRAMIMSKNEALATRDGRGFSEDPDRPHRVVVLCQNCCKWTPSGRLTHHSCAKASLAGPLTPYLVS